MGTGFQNVKKFRRWVAVVAQQYDILNGTKLYP